MNDIIELEMISKAIEKILRKNILKKNYENLNHSIVDKNKKIIQEI